MKDKTSNYVHLWKHISNDGHPSYSPLNDGSVVFDTYPDKKRIQEIKIAKDSDIDGKNIRVIAKVFSPLNMIMILVVIFILVGVEMERKSVLMERLKVVEVYIL